MSRPRTLFPGAIPILVFLLTATAAFFAVREEATLGFTAEQCGPNVCVAWVMPGGFAWSGGVRAGDTIIAADDVPIKNRTGPIPWDNLSSIIVIDSGGTQSRAATSVQAIGHSPLKWSLWAVAAFFAVLGSLVWYRRPDLGSASSFGRMASTAAVALAIGPVAGGPVLPWALAIETVSLIVLAFTFFDFIYQLVSEHALQGRAAGWARSAIAALTIVNLFGYLPDQLRSQNMFGDLTNATLACALLASVFLLLVAVLRAPGGSDEDRLRVPLLGMLLGVTPFPIATLLPLALNRDPLAPHLMVLPVILMPAAFAYSILHDQLWGIRRLIHRGLVYALISATVFGFVVVGIALVNGMSRNSNHSTSEILAISFVAFLGVLVYRPISHGARWLIDRLIYGTTLSYPEFVHGLQRNIASADPESELPDTLNHVLADHLELESALLYKHDDEADRVELLSAVGEHTSRVLAALRDKRISLPKDAGQESPVIIPFEGEQLLAMELWASREHVGTIVLGPKKGGDLFIQDEINLIANSAPFLAAALERHEMSQTMRHLNKRLIETDEHSRQRMAVDLHDGPLQKAVALAIGRITDPGEQAEVAKELVDELRELGTRLRPSILDNLGLLSLDWLLEHNMRGTDIKGVLDIDLDDPTERFHPDIELALFRVTQEAINNAVKHSSASELRVHLERNEDHLVLTIKDDGVGIGGAGSGRIPSSRLGMIGMRERVLQVGGHLEVHSWPNRGVFIQATVPATPSPEKALAAVEE